MPAPLFSQICWSETLARVPAHLTLFAVDGCLSERGHFGPALPPLGQSENIDISVFLSRGISTFSSILLRENASSHFPSLDC